MIEINLVPDIKQELIKAQRTRASVISIAIIVGIGAVSAVVLLAIWVFGVQFGREYTSSRAIKEKNAILMKHEDLSDTLTIQNQLKLLSTMHDQKTINSRLFDILTTVNPPAPNNIQITTATLDAETNMITLEAQAPNGYPALETFRKTINATKFKYTVDGEENTIDLASDLSDTERSYGEDPEGNRVLRFTLSFVFSDDLFLPTSKNAVIVAPTTSNVTDSFLGVPTSLFTQKESDSEGDN